MGPITQFCFFDVRVGNPLHFVLHVPVVVMSSEYVNSGKLIVIRASGGGAMSNTFGEFAFVCVNWTIFICLFTAFNALCNVYMRPNTFYFYGRPLVVLLCWMNARRI